MWLDNYKYCKQALMLAYAKTYNAASFVAQSLLGFARATDGATVTTAFPSDQSAVGLLGPIVFKGGTAGSGPNGALSPVFGRGAVVPTSTDYILAEPIEAGLTVGGVEPYWNEVANALVIPITVTNTLSEPMTIAELGLMKRFYTAQNSYKNVLMYREVLADAVTLAGGETATLTVTVPFN